MTSNAEEIECRRRSYDPTRRPGAAAESHQTRHGSATEAPCCAQQAEVGKEGQLGRTAAKSQRAAKRAKSGGDAREGSKAAKVLELLRRPDGASLNELMKSTGWLAHSVRGFLSGTVAKRMGLKLVSAKSENRERRYSLQG